MQSSCEFFSEIWQNQFNSSLRGYPTPFSKKERMTIETYSSLSRNNPWNLTYFKLFLFIARVPYQCRLILKKKKKKGTSITWVKLNIEKKKNVVTFMIIFIKEVTCIKDLKIKIRWLKWWRFITWLNPNQREEFSHTWDIWQQNRFA